MAPIYAYNVYYVKLHMGFQKTAVLRVPNRFRCVPAHLNDNEASMRRFIEQRPRGFAHPRLRLISLGSKVLLL